MEYDSSELVSLTSGIVAAYVGTNSVSSGDLPALIATVHNALMTAGATTTVASAAPPKPTAAQIRRSITPDALISFEDGRAFRTLKRHLAVKGLTIAEYKAKWGLPNDYPTTAATYSAARSALARAAGLGHNGRGGAPATSAKPHVTLRASAAGAPARRGRSKKVVA